MTGLGSDLSLILYRTVRIFVARWRLVGVLAGALVAANLVQAALGDARQIAPPLAFAMTALFLVARLAVLVSLHIVGVRLADDVRLPAIRVLALDGRQAVWFHGLVLIWIVALCFRYGIGAPSMRIMTAHGVPSLLADIAVTAAYLLLLFVSFVRIQPGVVGVMLGHPGVTLGWSIRAVRGYVWRLFLIATTLGIPPLLLRQTLTHALAGNVLATALVDGALSTAMMLLPSVTYHRVYERIRAGGQG